MIGTISGSITHGRISSPYTSRINQNLRRHFLSPKINLSGCTFVSQLVLETLMGKTSKTHCCAANLLRCSTTPDFHWIHIRDLCRKLCACVHKTCVCAYIEFIYRQTDIINGGSFINSRAAAAPLTPDAACGYINTFNFLLLCIKNLIEARAEINSQN